MKMKSKLICGVGVNDMRGKWCCSATNTSSPTYNKYEYIVYNTWKAMLVRSYKQGVSRVCDRWKLFSNFIKDIRYIPGYSLFLRHLGTKFIFLDKDTRYCGNKTYDPSTVRFITVHESNKEMNARTPLKNSRKVLRVNIKDPNDVKEYVSVASTRLDGFSFGSVARCCRGQQTQHRGYYWRYL